MSEPSQEIALVLDLYEVLHVAIRLVDALEVIGEESDGGPRIENLLTRIYDRARTSDDRSRELVPYIGSLLGRRYTREISNPSLPLKSASSGVLSEREHITLVWMSCGLSNKEIAKKLGIAPETVKSHAKNIFAKLTVKTRAEAVSRANGLGLI
jgi:DNA-binding CsgD family transcriptional regulator